MSGANSTAQQGAAPDASQVAKTDDYNHGMRAGSLSNQMLLTIGISLRNCCSR
jgi:hypothetical protein